MAQRLRRMVARQGRAVREDREMTAVNVRVEPFWAKHNRRSFFVYLPVAFVVFVQSSWRVGSRATISIGINVHDNGTQAIWRGVNR